MRNTGPAASTDVPVTTRFAGHDHRKVGHVGVKYLLELNLHAGLRRQAFERIAMRDADDWPVLACAMTPGCPVWTENADFFGSGVAM